MKPRPLIHLTSIGICSLLLLTGCISAASVGHSGKKLVDTSHKVDALQSAYLLPDGNIVLFVSGRLSKREGKADFSLLVPHATLKEMRLVKNSASYTATIGPPSEFKLNDWTPIRIDTPKGKRTIPLRYDDYIPAQDEPVIYEIPRAPGAANEKGLNELWGQSRLFYVADYSSGTPFRCEIVPKAERIEKTRNGLLWLPVTVPLDVATLPVQALWGALFVGALAAEAAGSL